MTQVEIQQEALSRATGFGSTRNYMVIINGFAAKGVAVDDIRPRENVLTFHAWKAKGRTVKKGEHGVKVITFIPVKGKGKEEAQDAPESTKPRRGYSRPRSATVFHISQTKPLNA